MAPLTGSTFVPVPKQSLQTSDVFESSALLFDSGLSIIDSLVRDYNIRVLEITSHRVVSFVISHLGTNWMQQRVAVGCEVRSGRHSGGVTTLKIAAQVRGGIAS